MGLHRMKKKINNYCFLIKNFWKYGKVYFFLAAVIAILTNLVSIWVATCLNRDIINAISEQRKFFQIVLIAVVFEFCSFLVMLLDSSINMCCLNRMFVNISAKLNLIVYKKAQQLKLSNLDNPAFYDNYSWTIKEYVKQSDDAINLFIKTLVSTFSLATLLVLLSTTGWFILLITIVYLILIVPLDAKNSRLNVKKQEQMQHHNRKLNYVQRVFYLKEFAQTLKLTLIPVHLFRWYDKTVEEKKNTQSLYNGKINLIACIQFFLQHLFTLSVLIFYIWQVYNGKISIGVFVSLVSAATLLRRTFYNFTTHYKKFNEIALSTEKIQAFFSAPIEEERSLFFTEEENLKPYHIQFHNVSFCYPGKKIGVSNINFDVQPGSRIAIVGSNGAGKTTILKLLLGLYEPQQGEILVNGVSLNHLCLSNYRKSVGVALQDTNIFAISVHDNLSRYREMHNDEIRTALNNLSLNRIQEQSDLDYQTPLLRDFDKNGIELSGGERQKIALAAILYQNFPLLILDEPTSSLDPISEFELNQIILNKATDSTTIIISHRLAAIKGVDKIIVLDHGEIIEYGTHQELIEKQGFYYDMFSKQTSLYT